MTPGQAVTSTIRGLQLARAVSTNVRGVDVESGMLGARTQDEGAVWTASRTRTPRVASLTDRTVQRLVDTALELLPALPFALGQIALAGPDRLRCDLDELIFGDPLNRDLERHLFRRLELDRLVG